MKRTFALLCLLGTVALGGCAQQVADFKAKVAAMENAFALATTETVPASTAAVAINAFDALKATATTYGEYCIKQKMAPAVCAVENRRAVVQFVRSGTKARDAVEASVANKTPVLATVYNTMVAAIEGLRAQPIANTGS